MFNTLNLNTLNKMNYKCCHNPQEVWPKQIWHILRSRIKHLSFRLIQWQARRSKARASLLAAKRGNEMLTAFLEDMRKESLSKRSGNAIGEGLLQELITESRYITDKSWVRAIPASSGDIATCGLGTVVSGYRDGMISRPTCLRQVGSEIWVGSYGKAIAKFDQNFSFLGYWKGQHGNPSTEEFYYGNVSSFAVDVERDRIYVAMDTKHRVRAFKLSTGELLWQFGSGRAGYVKTLRLYNPVDVELLPNGNVLVTCANGIGYDPINQITANGHGHVTELNGETGELVASRLMNLTNGQPWSGEVSSPSRARILEDGLLYVSLYESSMVGVWNPETWEFVTLYSKPLGFDAGSLSPRGITLSQDKKELVVACNAPKILMSLDIATHDYAWHTGHASWDDKENADHEIGAFHGMWDVLLMSDDRYLVADYGNNRLQVVTNKTHATVQYNTVIPSGYEAAWWPDGYDIENHTMAVPYGAVEQARELYLPLRRIRN